MLIIARTTGVQTDPLTFIWQHLKLWWLSGG